MVSEQDKVKDILRHNNHSLCIGCDVIVDGEYSLICNQSMHPIPDDERECPIIMKMIQDAGLDRCMLCICLDADRCGDVFYPVCEIRDCPEFGKLEEVSEKQAELIK